LADDEDIVMEEENIEIPPMEMNEMVPDMTAEDLEDVNSINQDVNSIHQDVNSIHQDVNSIHHQDYQCDPPGDTKFLLPSKLDTKNSKKTPKPKDIEEEYEEFWKLSDPHSQSTIKPFQKGKIPKLYVFLEKAIADGNLIPGDFPTDSFEFIMEMSKKLIIYCRKKEKKQNNGP
jgi:hypothetical protein